MINRYKHNIRDLILQGLLFWLAGGIIFFAIEVIYNFWAGRLFISAREPIAILSIYLLGVLSGGIFSGSLRYILKEKLLIEKMDNQTWFWMSFFAFWLFVYILLWVNDKNPYTFFAPVSVVANVALILIFAAPSLLIYKTCVFLKRRGFKDLFLVFVAFCIAGSTYIIFGLELNWHRYRTSVEQVERFFTPELIFYNIYLLLGAGLLFVVSFYLLFLSKKLFRRYRLNKSGIIAGGILFILLLVLLYPFLVKSPDNKKTFTSPLNKDMPNIVLIVIDAVRSSQLGCYGYPKSTSPSLDKLAEEGFLFENCISNFTHTKTAVPSLLSSQYVTLSRLKDKKFIMNLKFLQEYLAEKNYSTLLFIGANFSPDTVIGMNRGFDYCPTQWGSYYDYFLPRAGITLYKFIITRKYETRAWVADAERLVDKFNLWLNKNRDVRFFAYFDFQNTHSPYHVPATYNRNFYQGSPEEAYQLGREWELKQNKIEREKIKDIIALYDDAIRYQDQCIGKIFEILQGFGLYDNTMIIILADHGESFLDHGTTHHAHSLYDEIVKVPLIIKLPGEHAPKRIKEIVALIDIAPTILDFLEVDISRERFEGKSLLPFVRGLNLASSGPRYAISLKEGNFIGIRTDRWKLVISDESKRRYFGTREIGHRSSKELFDLERDPLELENVYDRYKEESEVRELEQILLEYKKRLYDRKSI